MGTEVWTWQASVADLQALVVIRPAVLGARQQQQRLAHQEVVMRHQHLHDSQMCECIFQLLEKSCGWARLARTIGGDPRSGCNEARVWQMLSGVAGCGGV